MIELPILQYNFDEERLGFEAPAMAPPPKRSIGEYIGIACVAIGLLVFLLAVLAGVGRGTWGAFLGSFGAMSVGGVIAWWFRYKDTTPGIKHHNNTFNNIQRYGILAWGLGVFITGFYIVLYWYGGPPAPGHGTALRNHTPHHRSARAAAHRIRGQPVVSCTACSTRSWCSSWASGCS